MDNTKNVRAFEFGVLMDFKREWDVGNKTWDDFAVEDLPLISGSGNDACETEFHIKNECPAWKELLNEQKKEPLINAEKKCDVYISCDGGSIPCHRPFLKMSKFLDDLVTENLKANMPSKDVFITLTGVHIDQLKAALTLFYTGACLINESTYDDFTDLMKLLQIDKKKWMKDPNFNGKSKKERFRNVKVFTYVEDDVASVDNNVSHSSMSSTSGASAQRSPSKQTSVPSSSQAGASTVPGPSGSSTSAHKQSASSSSVQGPSNSSHQRIEVPLITKVAPGAHLAKKPKERIKRLIPGQDETSGDEFDKAPLPEVRKVPPGTLLPKAPRIIRKQAQDSPEIKKGSKTKEAATVSDDEDTLPKGDDDDSLPKGSYEKSCVNDEYVPSGDDGTNDAEEISNTEDGNLSDEDDLPRRTRHAVATNPKCNARYSLRKRKKRKESSFEESHGKDKTPKKNHQQDEPIAGTSKSIHSKSPGPSKKPTKPLVESSDESEGDTEKFRCKYCSSDYNDIYALKSHLEDKCAKHITTIFDIIKKYCKPCNSYFKSYSTVEFMNHVDVCVCNYKPPNQRQRRTSSAQRSPHKTPDTDDTNKPGTSTEQFNESSDPRKTVGDQLNKDSEVVGLKMIKVNCGLKLTPEEVIIMKDKLRKGEPLMVPRPLPLPAFRYVFGDEGTTQQSAPPPDSVQAAIETTQHTAPPPDSVQAPIETNQHSAPSPDFVQAAIADPMNQETSVDPTPQGETTASADTISKSSHTATVESSNISKTKKPNSGSKPGPLSRKRKANKEDTLEQSRRVETNDNDERKRSRVESGGQKENNHPSAVIETSGNNSDNLATVVEKSKDMAPEHVATAINRIRSKSRTIKSTPDSDVSNTVRSLAATPNDLLQSSNFTKDRSSYTSVVSSSSKATATSQFGNVSTTDHALTKRPNQDSVITSGIQDNARDIVDRNLINGTVNVSTVTQPTVPTTGGVNLPTVTTAQVHSNSNGSTSATRPRMVPTTAAGLTASNIPPATTLQTTPKADQRPPAGTITVPHSATTQVLLTPQITTAPGSTATILTATQAASTRPSASASAVGTAPTKHAQSSSISMPPPPPRTSGTAAQIRSKGSGTPTHHTPRSSTPSISHSVQYNPLPKKNPGPEPSQKVMSVSTPVSHGGQPQTLTVQESISRVITGGQPQARTVQSSTTAMPSREQSESRAVQIPITSIAPGSHSQPGPVQATTAGFNSGRHSQHLPVQAVTAAIASGRQAHPRPIQAPNGGIPSGGQAQPRPIQASTAGIPSGGQAQPRPIQASTSGIPSGGQSQPRTLVVANAGLLQPRPVQAVTPGIPSGEQPRVHQSLAAASMGPTPTNQLEISQHNTFPQQQYLQSSGTTPISASQVVPRSTTPSAVDITSALQIRRVQMMSSNRASSPNSSGTSISLQQQHNIHPGAVSTLAVSQSNTQQTAPQQQVQSFSTGINSNNQFNVGGVQFTAQNVQSTHIQYHVLSQNPQFSQQGVVHQQFPVQQISGNTMIPPPPVRPVHPYQTVSMQDMMNMPNYIFSSAMGPGIMTVRPSATVRLPLPPQMMNSIRLQNNDMSQARALENGPSPAVQNSSTNANAMAMVQAGSSIGGDQGQTWTCETCEVKFKEENTYRDHFCF